jgi:hypothetical protein
VKLVIFREDSHEMISSVTYSGPVGMCSLIYAFLVEGFSTSRWARHVACTEDVRDACSTFITNLKGWDHL